MPPPPSSSSSADHVESSTAAGSSTASGGDRRSPAQAACNPPQEHTEEDQDSVEDVIHKAVVLAELTSLRVDEQPSAIATPGETMWALQDPTRTAWVYEAEFRTLDATSQHEYLATVGIMNCISVVVSHPSSGVCFMAHVNPPAVLTCVEQRARNPQTSERILGDMCCTLRDLFAGHAMSDVKVALIGGWTEADSLPMLERLNPTHAALRWNFSSVVHEAVQTALPDAFIDCVHLNRFPGVSWCNRTRSNKLAAIIRGHAFRVVVLCRTTGQVELQTTDISDLKEGGCANGCPVPAHALIEGMHRLRHANERMRAFLVALDAGTPPLAVMAQAGLEEAEAELRAKQGAGSVCCGGTA